jgi:hypothetical protein
MLRGCQRSAAGQELGAETDAAGGVAASDQGSQIDRVNANLSESAHKTNPNGRKLQFGNTYFDN